MDRQRLIYYFSRAIVLMTALPIHEFSHALVADKLGDHTARNRGRLTVNPFVHLDLIGSVLIIFAGFGWAKPVPVDPRNFKKPRQHMALTALAGPVSNLLFALLLMCGLQLVDGSFGLYVAIGQEKYTLLWYMLYVMVFTNISLAVFNCLPVPPLDGSKILGFVLPDSVYFNVMRYERYIAIVVFVLIWTGALSRPLSIVANWLFNGLWTITEPLKLLIT